MSATERAQRAEELYDEVDMQFNRPHRMCRLNAEQRRLHEERLADLMTLSDREDSGPEEEVDSFNDDDNSADEDYVPPENAPQRPRIQPPVPEAPLAPAEASVAPAEAPAAVDDDGGRDEEASDAENPNDAVLLSDVESSSDDDEDEDDEPPAPGAHPAEPHFAAKDDVYWMKDPPVTGRPQAHNVCAFAWPGPRSNLVQDPLELFKLFVTPKMVDIMCRESNRKAKRAYRKMECSESYQKATDMEEHR